MSTGTLSENWVSGKRMSDLEAAHFAGFVDGEGTITIVTMVRKESRIGRRYRACFQVANTDVTALEQLRERCGNGSIVSNFHRRKENHRPVFNLRFTTDQIRHVLPQIVPYLIVKERQASILLAFLAVNANWKWHQLSQEEWDRYESFRQRITALNQRGETASEERPPVMRASRLGNNQFVKAKV